MHTLPEYQRARQEALHRSPWALLVVLTILAAVVLLRPGAAGDESPTPRPSVVAPSAAA